MLKTVLRVLTTLIILTILTAGGIYFYNLDRTYFNKEDEIGNTTGNIYNGGMFSEQGGKIYFSNDYDNGNLYEMSSNCTNIKKVTDDKAVYINVDENYIYYVRANNTKENNNDGYMVFSNTGVYRINQNGTDLKAFTGNPGAYLMLKGNNIYFQRYDVDTGTYLYRYRIDGSQERLLIKDTVIPVGVYDDALIYADTSKDHNINSLDLKSYTIHSMNKGSYLYPIYMGNYIYYIDISDGYKLYRMNKDGSAPTKLVNKRCSTYNITNSGKYLYYQVDNGKKSGIYRLNLDTMKAQLLKKGDFKQISVTDNYVFFKDYDNTNTYFIAADVEDAAISTFDTLLSTK